MVVEKSVRKEPQFATICAAAAEKRRVVDAREFQESHIPLRYVAEWGEKCETPPESAGWMSTFAFTGNSPAGVSAATTAPFKIKRGAHAVATPCSFNTFTAMSATVIEASTGPTVTERPS
eukprot:TRINITY_DN9473_c0_g1_i1.p3 TRINITY_DN9473_c0_g1~~TRINITY_DN9473_c0_g1_i1.p3  ORF type:complete len:120 (-),score=16.74 TRINITY_DN9473_c0_g1_i1:352-711(-)